MDFSRAKEVGRMILRSLSLAVHELLTVQCGTWWSQNWHCQWCLLLQLTQTMGPSQENGGNPGWREARWRRAVGRDRAGAAVPRTGRKPRRWAVAAVFSVHWPRWVADFSRFDSIRVSAASAAKILRLKKKKRLGRKANLFLCTCKQFESCGFSSWADFGNLCVVRSSRGHMKMNQPKEDPGFGKYRIIK